MSSQDASYQISIIEDKMNPIMERRELKIEVASQATPKRDLLRKSIAASLKVPVERVFVKNVVSSFGTNVAICKAHVYESEERGKEIEPKYIQLRNLSRAERKAAMAPAPAEQGAQQK
ncbi:MAG: 30S ribosomal protein S24e [Candidatus Methanomethylicia archaeon]|nr:30S ribosomal protein S24e [Candidatus Methanomethylicia archaeon]